MSSLMPPSRRDIKNKNTAQLPRSSFRKVRPMEDISYNPTGLNAAEIAHVRARSSIAQKPIQPKPIPERLSRAQNVLASPYSIKVNRAEASQSQGLSSAPRQRPSFIRPPQQINERSSIVNLDDIIEAREQEQRERIMRGLNTPGMLNNIQRRWELDHKKKIAGIPNFNSKPLKPWR